MVFIGRILEQLKLLVVNFYFKNSHLVIVEIISASHQTPAKENPGFSQFCPTDKSHSG